jgi:hypothetical protein
MINDSATDPLIYWSTDGKSFFSQYSQSYSASGIREGPTDYHVLFVKQSQTPSSLEQFYCLNFSNIGILQVLFDS